MTLSGLAADSDLNVKMAAVMVDKMLKEIVLESDHGKLDLANEISQFLPKVDHTKCNFSNIAVNYSIIIYKENGVKVF